MFLEKHVVSIVYRELHVTFLNVNYIFNELLRNI